VPKRYTALFLANSTGCTVCMGQFQIYDRFINESGLAKIMNRVLAVVDSNKNRATWFARVNELKMNSIANVPLEMEKILINYEGNIHAKQIILIDNITNKIVLRIKVKAGITVAYEEIKDKLSAVLKKIDQKLFYAVETETYNRRG
jgi:sulfate adenylyltransferase subunit 1 (EFTu-like GTPase family)